MKTRKYILPLLALMISFISAKSYAQDIVVMKDGTILDVYNLKESSTYYYFSSDSSSNAIVKKVKKADVFSVKKKDGTIIPATSDTVTTKSLDSAVHKPVTAQLSSEITKKRRQKIFSARTPDGHELNYAILSDDDHTLKVIKGTYHESKYIIPDYVQVNDIKYTVTEIDDGAFKMEYTVVSVDFPSTLKKIGDEAFEYSGLKKAILPEGLESIGDHAFVGCPLSQISIPSSIKYDVGEKAFAYSENGLFTGEILQISENLLKDIYTRWGISQESFEEYIASKTSKKANSSKGSTIVSKPSDNLTAQSSNIKDLTEAAEQGDAKSQFRLGRRHETGNGVTQDYVQANNSVAQEPASSTKSQTDEIKKLKEKAEQGHAEAIITTNAETDIIEQLKKENVSETDLAMFILYTKLLAEKGDAKAQNVLAKCYYHGIGVDQDYGEAAFYYLKAAQQGMADAQFLLAKCYYEGIGVAQDDEKAVYWLRKAAEQGNAGAQTYLGMFYFAGEGVVQDYNQAVKWASKAAEQGNADAQCLLAKCYYEGKGVAQDYIKAVKWFRKAAEQGDAGAQTYLGLCYFAGKGVVQDYNQAVKWASKAAEQGNADAQCILAKCYYEGKGVVQDYNQAVKWYKKAAEQGNAVAQFFLAKCYYEGKGVAKDNAHAIYWYKKAAAQGNEEAQKVLDELLK